MPSTTITATSRRNPVALVTGGTTGIGFEACKQLAAQGIDVILTSRTKDKGAAAVNAIRAHAVKNNNANVNVSFLQVELGNLASVVAACEELTASSSAITHVDYLLLNAGVKQQGNGDERIMSDDGIESTVAINHVASCLFAIKLIPLLQKSSKTSPTNKRSMITFVSSDLHNIHSSTGAARTLKPLVEDDMVRYLSNQGMAGVDATIAMKTTNNSIGNNVDKAQPSLTYNGIWSYKYSKMMNVLSAQAIHDKGLPAVGCNSMEPGFVPSSDLSRGVKQVLGPFFTRLLIWNLHHGPIHWLVEYMLGQPVRTLEEAAKSEVYALTRGESGKYYRLDQVDDPTPLVLEPNVVQNVWKNTMALLKSKGCDVVMGEL